MRTSKSCVCVCLCVSVLCGFAVFNICFCICSCLRWPTKYIQRRAFDSIHAIKQKTSTTQRRPKLLERCVFFLLYCFYLLISLVFDLGQAPNSIYGTHTHSSIYVYIELLIANRGVAFDNNKPRYLMWYMRVCDRDLLVFSFNDYSDERLRYIIYIEVIVTRLCFASQRF